MAPARRVRDRSRQSKRRPQPADDDFRLQRRIERRRKRLQQERAFNGDFDYWAFA